MGYFHEFEITQNDSKKCRDKDIIVNTKVLEECGAWPLWKAVK